MNDSVKDNPEAGFTLIELLISLTLMAMMLSVSATGIYMISRGWENTADRVSRLEIINRVGSLFLRDVGSMRRVFYEKDKAHKFIFSAGVKELMFVAVEPEFPTVAGPYFIRYFAKSGSAGSHLVRERAVYRRGMQVIPEVSGANQVVLLKRSFDYAFSYGVLEGAALSWSDRWSSEDRLPHLIRLTVKTSLGGQVVSIPFVAAVRINAEQSCLGTKERVCSVNKDGLLKVVRGKKSNEEQKSKQQELLEND